MSLASVSDSASSVYMSLASIKSSSLSITTLSASCIHAYHLTPPLRAPLSLARRGDGGEVFPVFGTRRWVSQHCQRVVFTRITSPRPYGHPSPC